MRLSALFGEPNVQALLSRMPLKEYQQWKLLDEVEGIGWKREDRRIARALLWCLSAQGVKEIDEQTFLFEFDKELQRPTNESSERAVFEAFGVTPRPRRRTKRKRHGERR